MWTVTWLVSWGAGTLLATAPAAPGFTFTWSNVLLEVEEPAVEEHFLDCGSVVAVRIVRDPVTGVGRGFGYVLFEVWKTDVLSLSFEMYLEGSSPLFIIQTHLSLPPSSSTLRKLNS